RQLISPDDLREQMLSAISDRAFIGEDEVPRTNVAFMQLKQRARARFPAVVDASVRLMIQIGQEYPLLMQKLNALSNHQSKLKRDLEQQLGQLLAARFLTQTPWERLQHLPRYLQAMRMRIEKYANSPDRDQRHAEAIQAIWQRWQQKIQQLEQAQREIPQGLLDYRWLIEELRVSLFAQELKTPFPVSVKRLDKIWDELKI
ncbi:MAG: DUF3418 domain-containing protein, partial [Methylophilaceae bacterium]